MRESVLGSFCHGDRTSQRRGGLPAVARLTLGIDIPEYYLHYVAAHAMDPTPPNETSHKPSLRNLVAWVVVLACVIGLSLWLRERLSSRESSPASEAPAVTEAPAQPIVRYPLPASTQQQNAKPLPPLDESDSDLSTALEDAGGPPGLDDLFVPKDLIRKFVVVVDNLPNRRVPVEQLPLRPPAGQFKTMTLADRVYLDPRNFVRYDRYLEFLEGLDNVVLVKLYRRYYPLFQQAYEELGYPGRYFNDRLVVAIDDLLAAPTVEGPIELVQPSVFYKFADPKLESLSAGQRLMLRMGPDNAVRVKGKLTELRAALTQR